MFANDSFVAALQIIHKIQQTADQESSQRSAPGTDGQTPASCSGPKVWVLSSYGYPPERSRGRGRVRVAFRVQTGLIWGCQQLRVLLHSLKELSPHWLCYVYKLPLSLTIALEDKSLLPSTLPPLGRRPLFHL